MLFGIFNNIKKMIKIPQEVQEAWKKRQGPVVLTTISKQGIPNSIYATFAGIFEEDKVWVANNKFCKTLQNILECDKADILFLTEENKAYQFKGTISHKTEGKEFDEMKKWNRADLPGKGAAILDVQEIYSGAKKIV